MEDSGETFGWSPRRVKVPFGTLAGTETVGRSPHALRTTTANGTKEGPSEEEVEPNPTPRGCTHRYFTFVHNFGAHNNQLISLLSAFAIAKNLSRTLVIPPFIQGLKPERYYNFSLLLFCYGFSNACASFLSKAHRCLKHHRFHFHNHFWWFLTPTLNMESIYIPSDPNLAKRISN